MGKTSKVTKLVYIVTWAIQTDGYKLIALKALNTSAVYEMKSKYRASIILCQRTIILGRFNTIMSNY